jgi:hypothetical protein
MVSPVMSVKRLVGRVPSFGFPSERRSVPAERHRAPTGSAAGAPSPGR